uniref:Rho-GAP domain-containing protein n=1 Tax=Panagrolaimus sp. PS1159 TaxID=55785 RepID=A0AC35GCX2_9BILA
MSKNLQSKNSEKIDGHLPSPPCTTATTTTLSLKSEKEFKKEEVGSPSLNLSSSTKISFDELSNLSEVDSLIKELDESPSTHCNRPQGGTPSTRTSSWAANLATNPPPLPVTSVPSTPIMSKYRIMNSSMKISPDNNVERNDTPTSTKSAVNDGYFFHYEDSVNPFVSGVQRKFTNFASKIVNGQRLKPMSLTMNHPTSDNNSEASLTRSDISERQISRLGGALFMRNAAFDANATFPFVQRHYEIDELLDYDSDYLYDVQPADKLHIVRELALQEVSHYIERSVPLRIKQWGQNLDVIKNLLNKFSRSQPSERYNSDKLFGMPLYMIQAKNGNGNPFPKFAMDIMEYLKESAINVDGIFRRCGSKLRIAEMRKICDDLHVHDSLPEDFKTLSQVNDLSDLLKQYLR